MALSNLQKIFNENLITLIGIKVLIKSVTRQMWKIASHSWLCIPCVFCSALFYSILLLVLIDFICGVQCLRRFRSDIEAPMTTVTATPQPIISVNNVAFVNIYFKLNLQCAVNEQQTIKHHRRIHFPLTGWTCQWCSIVEIQKNKTQNNVFSFFFSKGCHFKSLALSLFSTWAESIKVDN